ncbi:hypothetical protein PFL1_03081 [Ceraceosorus bombacis]|uniref:Uncharacterized protein n=1 Tax=Ceraceosorus bombacis TaxID=401625 RepID=A0A0P1BJM2_9BASI|nr:hypothetical protein PFL1_03081 [Ceraceosorus bombacis]
MSLEPDVTARLPKVASQLIVYDFDWSLADQDTDRWVHEVHAPDLRRRIKERDGTVQFTDLCAGLLRELHGRGITPDQIKDAMRVMPFHPAMRRGVLQSKVASTPQTTFFLLSNSNSVYIDTILQHQGLKEAFTEVVTNPAHFEENGLLNLSRRIPADAPAAQQHKCKVGCSPNMCKGEELEAFLARHGGRSAFERIVYVGDGGNDYCPVLRLGPKDVALVRRYRGLEKRIEKEGGVEASIRFWAGAWEVEGLLKELRGEY